MNKDEMKMIEEMSNEIDLAKKRLWNAENLKKDDYSWHSKGIATALYNAGYRKVGDDEIVESMKTYERARQETAKEILLVLKDNIVNRIGSKYAVIDLTDIAQLAKEKGIELED